MPEPGNLQPARKGHICARNMQMLSERLEFFKPHGAGEFHKAVAVPKCNFFVKSGMWSPECRTGILSNGLAVTPHSCKRSLCWLEGPGDEGAVQVASRL